MPQRTRKAEGVIPSDRALFPVMQRQPSRAFGPFRFTIVKKKNGLRAEARDAWLDGAWSDVGP